MANIIGNIQFSCIDLFGNMSVCCENSNCEYNDKTVCLLFKIKLNEEGQCKSFKKKE